MLDAFFSDDSSSSISNFDDSEKLKMLSDHGMFVIAMRSNCKNDAQNMDKTKMISTQDMVNALTAKNIFLPINNDGIVSHIFTGNNGKVNIVCASGLGFSTEYIANMGKQAISEQKQRLEKKKSFNLLDDLEELELEIEIPVKKAANKRKQVSLDLLNELD